MLLSRTRTGLVATAIALALPGATLATTTAAAEPVAHAAALHGPVAHRAWRKPAAHDAKGKGRNRAHCNAHARKHHKRRCTKAHKSSHKRARSSRLRHDKAPSALSTHTNSTPGNPAGTVPAPALTITGTTYYVSANGSDSNSGTSPSSAWRTVQRVDRAPLHPGDGVLFEGGASFSDEALMPSASGAAGSPIVFGSYGTGNATVSQGVWFKGRDHLAFEHLTIDSGAGIQGTGQDVTIEWCSLGNDVLAINAAAPNSNSENTNWTIDDNTIDHTGNSGMLLEGEGFTVAGNTITNTGLDGSISYGKHGIYLKVANATVTSNTIINSSADGISVRYRNSTVTRNYIQGAGIGVAWFQYDQIAGTSHWLENTIVGTTEAGFYISPSDVGGATRESFVIEHNAIQPASGVLTNLKPTTGTYALLENS